MICKVCNTKLEEYSAFKQKLFDNQTELYEFVREQDEDNDFKDEFLLDASVVRNFDDDLHKFGANNAPVIDDVHVKTESSEISAVNESTLEVEQNPLEPIKSEEFKTTVLNVDSIQTPIDAIIPQGHKICSCCNKFPMLYEAKQHVRKFNQKSFSYFNLIPYRK